MYMKITLIELLLSHIGGSFYITFKLTLFQNDMFQRFVFKNA